jgi:NTE family protein
MFGEGRKVVGLVLSGGGARGLAHIGVLKVFEREGIQIDCLSGASMGGILAAAYAAGFSAADLEAEALGMARLRRLVGLVDRLPPNRGLLAGRKLRTYLTQFLPPELTFAELRIPLALETVDLMTGQEVPLTEGSVLQAAMATSAFPGILPAVEWRGRRLVDGGLLDNLPVDLARGLGAEMVIAVNVGPMPDEAATPHRGGTSGHMPEFMRTAMDAIWIITNARTWSKLEANWPELLIHPHLSPDIGVFSSFTRAAEIIAIGEEAAERALPQLAAYRHAGCLLAQVA